MIPDPETVDLVRCAVAAADDKMAEDPVIIDVAQRLAIAEVFVVVSASNERQVRAIAEEIMDQTLVQLHRKPLRIEGRFDGHWVLLDYGEVVVDVFLESEREYYALEHLWGDGEVTHLATSAWAGVQVTPKVLAVE